MKRRQTSPVEYALIMGAIGTAMIIAMVVLS